MSNTICLALICKNEEHCIIDALKSVYKFINYWVICDTGSTDKTCEIVENFFREKNIPGELYKDEFIDFGFNKSLMMSRCKNKADYVLHFDADDLIIGDFDKSILDSNHDFYLINSKRFNFFYKSESLFKAKYSWKFCGVAHTIVRNLDKENWSVGIVNNKDWYILSQDIGARKSDTEKYKKEAEKLQKQFFDTLVDDPDLLNYRSVFYTAQSYFDFSNIKEAIKWYSIYTKLKDSWIEEQYESHLKIIKCMIMLEYSFERIKREADIAISIFDDRAEAYYLFGKYANDTQNNEISYQYLSKGKKCCFDEVQKKYILFLDPYSYGKFIDDELSVACYWTDRYQEGLELLLNIIEDKDFEVHKDRLLENLRHFESKIKTM